MAKMFRLLICLALPVKYSEMCQRLFRRMTGLMLTARKIECRFNKTADWTVAVTREIAAILETASTNLERLYLLKAGRFAQTQNAIFFAAKCRLDPFFKRTSRARWWTLESCFLNTHEWSWTWTAIENLSDNGVRMIRVVDKVVNRLTKSLKSAVSAIREGVLFPNQLEFDCCRRVSN